MAIFAGLSPGYKYGFRITSSNNNKVLLTLNARNELDRSRFISDLKEAVLEVSSTLAYHSHILSQNFSVIWLQHAHAIQHAVYLTHTHTVLTAIFQVNPGQPVPPWFSVSSDPTTVMTLFCRSLGILVVWYGTLHCKWTWWRAWHLALSDGEALKEGGWKM